MLRPHSGPIPQSGEQWIEVFNPRRDITGRATLRDCDKLARCIAAGQIACDRYEYEVGAEQDRLSRHEWLRHLAVAWLKSLGATDVMSEQNWYHGRADVASDSLRIAVECGNTEAHKVESCVISGSRFALFPYIPGVAYVFSPTDKSHEILAEQEVRAMAVGSAMERFLSSQRA